MAIMLSKEDDPKWKIRRMMEEDRAKSKFEGEVSIGIVTSLLAFSIAFANSFILVVFLKGKLTKRFGDFFIINLALVDLTIGLLVIPPYIPYVLTHDWKAGTILCHIWLFGKHATIFVSVLNKCVIVVDRYLMVVHTNWYLNSQTLWVLMMMTLSPWFSTLIIYAPVMFYWHSPMEDSKPGACLPPFTDNTYFKLFQSLLVFMLPFVFMVVFNTLILRSIHRQTSTFIQESGIPIIVYSNIRHFVPPVPGLRRGTLISLTSNKNSTDISTYGLTLDETPLSGTPVRGSAQASHTNRSKLKVQTLRFKNDRKAARLLMVLVFAFMICWLPYSVVTLVRAVCRSCVSSVLYEFTLWLVWINSLVNPILYCLLYKRFQEAYYSICPKKKVEPKNSDMEAKESPIF